MWPINHLPWTSKYFTQNEGALQIKKGQYPFCCRHLFSRGTIYHRTKVNNDNSTRVKNRDILLTVTEHRDTRLKPGLSRIKQDVW